MTNSEIPIFTADDDRPHVPEDDALWQESALFVWRDAATGLGGFWRLGQEPAAAAVNSCFGIFTADGVRFRSNVTGVPLIASDRGEGHMGWGPHLRVDFDGSARITAKFAACEADLVFSDFHPRFDYGALVMPGRTLTGAAHHFEVSGRMTGKVRIGDEEFAIDALGYRDRSWSTREWSGIRGTRWWPSVFGPDLSVHVLHLVRDGGILKLGYVWRDGQAIPLVDSDLVVALESDALTPRSGMATVHLTTGETMEISCDRADGIVMHVRGYTAVETIGTARLGDRVGFSNLEVCTNAAGGNRPPTCSIGSNLVDGLSRR